MKWSSRSAGYFAHIHSVIRRSIRGMWWIRRAQEGKRSPRLDPRAKLSAADKRRKAALESQIEKLEKRIATLKANLAKIGRPKR